MKERMPDIWEDNKWDPEPKFHKFPDKEKKFEEKFFKIDKILNEEINEKWDIMRGRREVNAGDILEIRGNFGNKEEFLRRVKAREVEIPSPTVGGLAGLLERFPQIGETGGIRYLLTSGLAVEAITGFRREHHDTDLVICDTSTDWWMKLVTDNVTHKKYWAEMSFEEGYLEETAWTARFIMDGKEYTILTVHPAVLIIQKLSNAWGRPPREKDMFDVKALIAFWKKKGFDKGWIEIMETAIAALPNERERERTRLRLEELLTK